MTAILRECGMTAERQVELLLPRGSVVVDVNAEETVHGIVHRIICECKNWRTNVPKEVAHAFRTVIQETGAHRGYIISKVGFQTGAIKAAMATNIDLVTFAEFQDIYFDKWIERRLEDIENEIGDIKTYYEPFGPPGYALLRDDTERAVYDAAYEKYLFVGLMLVPFSPYLRMLGSHTLPDLPFDVSHLEERAVAVPNDIKSIAGYREFLEKLVAYAKEGLNKLRAVNPITRHRPPETILRDD